MASLTLLEILLDGNIAKLRIESVRSGILVEEPLHSFPVSQVSGLDAEAFHEGVGSGVVAMVAELDESLCKIAGSVEGSRADVNVDHQLIECWPNGGKETSPCL
jgi:hypothetical protein